MTGRLLRRRSAGIAACALIVITGCGQDDPDLAKQVEKTTIRVGVPEVVDAAPLYIARDKGFFAEVGLTVEVVEIPANQALAKLDAEKPEDRVDIALGDYVPIFTQLDAGGKYRILAEGYAAGPGVLQIMAPRDGTVRSVADLLGKRVAVDPSYPLGSLTLAQTLKANALLPTDAGAADLGTGGYLTLVQMPFKQMSKALESGSIDAAWMVEPYVSSVEQTIGAHRVADTATGSLADLPLSGYVVTEGWSKRFPGTGKAFVAALQKAQRLANSNPGVVRAILPQYTKTTDVTAALVGIGSFPSSNSPTRLQRMVDLMDAYGLIKTDLIIHDYVGPAPEASATPAAEESATPASG